MAKKKTTMQPITNNSTRHSTFKKRKASLFKKAYELSSLCGVETCVVVSENPHDPKPDMWPSQEVAVQTLLRFKNMPEAVRTKKMLSRDGFLSQHVEKLRVQLQKVERENWELEKAVLLKEVLSGQSSIADVAATETVTYLSKIVQMRLEEVNKRVSQLVSTSAPSYATPDGWTPSAVPGWCNGSLQDFGLFSAPAPHCTTPDSFDFSAESTDLELIPNWCKEGENLSIFESTSADVVSPLSDFFTVGSDVDGEMNVFSDGLINGCDDETESFFNGLMDACEEKTMELFNNSSFWV